MSGSTTGRPTVQDVANLLRARTKDTFGNESGTFTEDTRPTSLAVDGHIDAAMALVATRLPALDTIAPVLLDAYAQVVAYRAALRIEKSYFPEQVRSDRSAYDQLLQEYLDDLAALVEAATTTAGPDDAAGASSDIASIPVGSWTSIRNPCLPVEPNPVVEPVVTRTGVPKLVRAVETPSRRFPT